MAAIIKPYLNFDYRGISLNIVESATVKYIYILFQNKIAKDKTRALALVLIVENRTLLKPLKHYYMNLYKPFKNVRFHSFCSS